jgi:predicted RNA-binding Zn ribbon-like protein
LILGQRFEPRTPLDALAPIVADVADLLAHGDASRIRKCGDPECVLHFYDISKKGTRRWCSMNLCGNRSKVAAYASRKRNEIGGAMT